MVQTLCDVGRKLTRAFTRYGLYGTVRRCVMTPYYRLWNSTPAGRRRHAIRLAWDRTRGVDTAQDVDLCDLEIHSPHWVDGVRYEPTDPDIFAQMMAHLAIPYKNFAFIDVGSGKGKVLLMASEFPFKKIIGLEFAPLLAAFAQQNIVRYNSPTQQCKDVQSLCVDAIEYAIPPDNIVFYLYNPFQGYVLSKFVKNIEKSLIDVPRLIFIIYYNPVHRDILNHSRLLKPIHSHQVFSIYTSVLDVSPSPL